MTIAANQRYNRARPCPICGGAEQDPRGQGRRCSGFIGGDRKYARCTRDEFAGRLAIDTTTTPATYAHRLEGGPCKCGVDHSGGPGERMNLWDRPRLVEMHAPVPPGPFVTPSHPLGEPSKWWDYRDEDGRTLFRVCRWDAREGGKKEIRQCSQDPKRSGNGKWDLNGARTDVLYRLPELKAADPARLVIIVEGEKAADAVCALGLLATTSPMGAGKWEPGDARGEVLRGRHVVILPDNDKPGREHAAKVTKALAGVAASVRVVNMPDVGESGDVVDWLAEGGTREGLEALIKAVPVPRPTLPVAEFVPSSQRLVGEREDRIEEGKRMVQYGISFPDDVFLGLMPRDITLIAMGGGVGKTQSGVSIARALSEAGKKPYYIALEADPAEIERRIKYQLVSRRYHEAGVHHGPISFDEWRAGKLDETLGVFEGEAEEEAAHVLANVRTRYQDKEHMTPDEFVDEYRRAAQEADVVILDHFHFLRMPGTGENAAVKDAMQKFRAMVEAERRPLIMLAQLRKRDIPQRAPLVPSIDDVRGSSDLTNIATRVLLAARGPRVEGMERYLFPTLMNVAKNRQGTSGPGVTAGMIFDIRTEQYQPGYTPGELVKDRREFKPYDLGEEPQWFQRSARWARMRGAEDRR